MTWPDSAHPLLAEVSDIIIGKPGDFPGLIGLSKNTSGAIVCLELGRAISINNLDHLASYVVLEACLVQIGVFDRDTSSCGIKRKRGELFSGSMNFVIR